MGRVKNNLGKYVSFNTDWGFKYYFGREEYKANLINFLNSLFEGEKVIKDLHYQSVELDGDLELDRKAVFDLYCTAEDGEHFIIEMQQISQDFFKDRTIFYTSRLINRLGKRGEKGNSYELPKVYFIGILEFDLESFPSDKYYYDVALIEKQTKDVFYDKLGFKYLVLPNFRKEESQISSYMDQWMYTLKNLSKFDKIPSCLDMRVFGLIFDIGKVANLNKDDMISYEASLKRKRDEENIRLTNERKTREREQNALIKGLEEGREEGREKGREFEKRVIAIKMKKMGLSIENIAEATGLSVDEINKI